MNPRAMQTLISCSLAVAAMASATAQGPAANPNQQAPNTASVMKQSFGMDFVDGALRAGGPLYKAEFNADGMLYTPALGKQAPANMPVRFELTSIRRGETSTYDAATARRVAPSQSGLVASYDRGNGVAETYEARVDGLKQNFTFTNVPAGSGDLIVEGRLVTNLPTPRLAFGQHGLRMEEPGYGGVEFGAVVGIDAFGQRTNGSLAFDGSTVSFALPASYVDNAAYPLVLDPLVGTIVVPNVSPSSDPDVAFDETWNQYLVVWEHEFSALDIDVRSQKVDLNGNLVATAIFVTNQFGNEINPTVANVDAGSDFFVAYQDGSSPFGPWNIRGRRVDGGSGTTTSALIDVAATADNEITPDASGDNTSLGGSFDGVIIAYDDSSGISAVKVDVSTNTVVAGPVSLDISSNATNPAISKSGGSGGRHLVVWQQDYGSDRDLQGALVDRDLVVLDSFISIAGGIPEDEFNADVDGDGDSWLVVFQEHESSNTGPSDIYCRRFEWNGSSVSAPNAAVLVEGAAGVDERDPAIGNLGLKYVAAWATQFSGLNYDIATVELNPANCLSCGVRQLNAGTGLNVVDINPEIATRWSGRATNNAATVDGGMIAWMDASSNPPFDADIVLHYYEAFEGGAVSNLGGGCGNGGNNAFNGPVALGNTDFNLSVNGAGSDLLLVSIMFVNNSVPCGGCQINGDTTSYLFAPGVGGSSSFDLPIPCDSVFIGSELYTQWASIQSGTNPCAIIPSSLQISYSNRMAATIGT